MIPEPKYSLIVLEGKGAHIKDEVSSTNFIAKDDHAFKITARTRQSCGLLLFKDFFVRDKRRVYYRTKVKQNSLLPRDAYKFTIRPNN